MWHIPNYQKTERIRLKCSLKRELKLSQGHEITGVYLVEGDKLDKESGAGECCSWGSMFSFFKTADFMPAFNFTNTIGLPQYVDHNKNR